MRIYVGSADPSTAFSAFARIFIDRFGIAATDSPDTIREKIIAGVSDVLPASRVAEVAHLIAHLMRVPFANSPVVAAFADTPQALQARTFIAIKRFFGADTVRGPLVLCFENLEESSADTINLLHYLVAGLATAPIALVATARQSLFDVHPTFGDCDVPLEKIVLGPLSEHEATELMRKLCAPLADIPERAPRSCKAAPRSPRALFELVRFFSRRTSSSAPPTAPGASTLLRSRASISPTATTSSSPGACKCSPPTNGRPCNERPWSAKPFGSTPSSPSHEPTRLPRASRTAPPSPALPPPETSSKPRSSKASAGSSIGNGSVDMTTPRRPGERELRFAYPYLWSAAYESTSDRDRARGHHVVAQWHALRSDGRSAEAQEEVGHHLALAGDGRGAAACLRRAAEAARREFFNDKAIRLFSRALACVGESDLAARMQLWHDLGSVYELKGEYEAALGGYERMLRIAWLCASRAKAAVALNKMGRVWRKKGNLTLALDYLERGHELFEQTADQRGIASSLDDIGKVLYLLGRYEEAYAKITEGSARRGHDGDPRSVARSLSNLGNIQHDRGRILEASNCHREALEMRQRSMIESAS